MSLRHCNASMLAHVVAAIPKDWVCKEPSFKFYSSNVHLIGTATLDVPRVAFVSTLVILQLNFWNIPWPNVGSEIEENESYLFGTILRRNGYSAATGCCKDVL